MWFGFQLFKTHELISFLICTYSSIQLFLVITSEFQNKWYENNIKYQVTLQHRLLKVKELILSLTETKKQLEAQLKFNNQLKEQQREN